MLPDAPSTTEGHHLRLAPLLAIALLGIAVATFAALTFHYDFVSDDAFITFRYARNWASGLGLVFNPGERVEGYTNFVEVAVLAGLYRLGVDLVAAGRGFSFAGGIATIVLTYVLARRAAIGRRVPALVAAGLLAVNPYLAVWAGAGLESTVFAALLLGAVLLLEDGPVTSRRFSALSALGLFLGMTRPEGVLLYALLAACVSVTMPGTLTARVRLLWPGLALFTALGTFYFASRWIYFGDPLPNTFYAKSGFTLRYVERGLAYVGEFAANPFVLCALPLVAAGVVTALFRRRFTLAAVPLATMALVVGEGGDGLPMYRFLVPAIPFFAVLAALGCDGLARFGARIHSCAGAGVALAVGLAAAAGVAVLSFFPNADGQYAIFEDQRDVEIPAWSAVGRALALTFPPETTFAAVPIGAVSYYSGLRVIDMVGLTDRTIAHTFVPNMGGAGSAGHEKHNGAYVLLRRPELLLLGNIFVDTAPVLPPNYFPPYDLPAIRWREKDVWAHPAFATAYVRRDLRIDEVHWLHYFARRDVSTR